MENILENSFPAILVAAFSLVGVIAGGWITNYTAIRRIDAEDRRIRYSAKLNAYSTFISEYQKFLLTAEKAQIQQPSKISELEMDAGISFSAAYSTAILHAPFPIRLKLQALYISACQNAQAGLFSSKTVELYGQVVDLLYEDLQRTLRRKHFWQH